MSEPRKCMRCQTYFDGSVCPRCVYQSPLPFARRVRTFAPHHPGQGREVDGDVRQIQPPYRPSVP